MKTSREKINACLSPQRERSSSSPDLSESVATQLRNKNEVIRRQAEELREHKQRIEELEKENNILKNRLAVYENESNIPLEKYAQIDPDELHQDLGFKHRKKDDSAALMSLTKVQTLQISKKLTDSNTLNTPLKVKGP